MREGCVRAGTETIRVQLRFVRPDTHLFRADLGLFRAADGGVVTPFRGFFRFGLILPFPGGLGGAGGGWALESEVGVARIVIR
jgi:hypothetical protein